MSRYESRRRSEEMRAYRPVETPDTDVATIFEQRWKRVDGGKFRKFTVLAFDEDQAEQLGRVRLTNRYSEHAASWEIDHQRACVRMTMLLHEVLMAETEEEKHLRSEAYFERQRLAS